MQEDGTAPADAAFATATGWTVGNSSAGRTSAFRANTERLSSTFAASPVQPDTEGLITGATNNAFSIPNPLTGTFPAGDWTISATLRSITSGLSNGQTQRLRWKVYQGANADGTSATEITTSYTWTPSGGTQQTGATMYSNTVAGLGNTTTNMPAFALTWAAPDVVLSNEYLFFVNGMEIIATGGNNANRDANFRLNSASAITTTDLGAGAPAAQQVVVPETFQPIAFY